jgi:hypothetical protein
MRSFGVDIVTLPRGVYAAIFVTLITPLVLHKSIKALDLATALSIGQRITALDDRQLLPCQVAGERPPHLVIANIKFSMISGGNCVKL